MPEEKEPTRPHGDPLREEVRPSPSKRRPRRAARQPDQISNGNREDNRAQQQSDAPSDLLTDAVPAPDADAEEKRRKQYENGAILVSRID